MSKYVIPLLCAVVLIIAGCGESPVDKLTNPLSEGALSGTSGIYTIYDDQLQTGGNIALFPGDYHGGDDEVYGGDKVEDSIGGCSEGPDMCLKYTWNGRKLWWPIEPGHTTAEWEDKWAGLALVVPSIAANWGQETRDLSQGKYTRITFYAKGALTSGVKVRFEGPLGGNDDAVKTDNKITVTPGKSTGAPALSTEWQKYTIDITGVSLSAMKHYFIVVFNTDGGTDGGTVYIDHIKYEK